MQDKIHNMILTPPSPYDMLRLASHSGGKRTYPDCFAPGEGEMTDRVGQQLGNYRLLRLLGRGGFADVYLGEHIYLKKPAALKVLHLRLDEQDAAQFLHEAQTLAGLDHPHIVRVFDFAVQDGMPFLVMDYAVGGTLRMRHPAGTRVPLERIIAYVNQVASALQYAHHQRLMHRDVKPENMLGRTRGGAAGRLWAGVVHPYPFGKHPGNGPGDGGNGSVSGPRTGAGPTATGQ